MTRWLPICLLIAASFVVGCKRGRESKTDEPENKKEETGGKVGEKADTPTFEPVTTVLKPELASARPEFVLTAKDLQKEWKDHGRATADKYRGKLLEITGFLGGVGTAPFFFIDADPLEAGSNVATCLVSPEHMRKIRQLSVGQSVKVLGKSVSDAPGRMDLDVIILTELSPSTILVATAERIAADFEKDANAAAKKYRQAKDFIVAGRIEEVKMAKLLDQLVIDSLRIKGSSKIKVVTVPVFVSDDSFDGKKEIEARVSFGDFYPKTNEVHLMWKCLIETK